MYKILRHPLKTLSYLSVICIGLVLGSIIFLVMFGLLLHANGVLQ
jgi:protein-S-isoprenylcysteine O-methyltransferase Ste14